MKGIVFTEFTNMVEEQFGLKVLDKILYSKNLPSEGVYTVAGNYDHNEMVLLVNHLSKITNTSVSDLLKIFGKHLFHFFAENYRIIIGKINDTLEFLENLDSYIHIEVAKLYPDAQLPKFDFERINNNCVSMLYQSERKFADLAYGLILGCADYFNQKIKIEKKDLSNGQGTKVKLIITNLTGE